MAFAITMHLHSPKGYEFLRKKFPLPSARIIQRLVFYKHRFDYLANKQINVDYLMYKLSLSVGICNKLLVIKNKITQKIFQNISKYNSLVLAIYNNNRHIIIISKCYVCLCCLISLFLNTFQYTCVSEKKKTIIIVTNKKIHITININKIV